MKFQFSEKKSSQAAAYLLKKWNGSANYMLLVKLLYLADKQNLAQYGFPITADDAVSMDRGPALSRITDFLSQKKQALPNSLWHKYIPRPAPKVYICELAENPGDGLLSVAEKETLDAIFEKWGAWDEFALSKHMHTFREFDEPMGSSIPISYEEMLAGAGVSPEVIAEIADTAESVYAFKS